MWPAEGHCWLIKAYIMLEDEQMSCADKIGRVLLMVLFERIVGRVTACEQSYWVCKVGPQYEWGICGDYLWKIKSAERQKCTSEGPFRPSGAQGGAVGKETFMTGKGEATGPFPPLLLPSFAPEHPPFPPRMAALLVSGRLTTHQRVGLPSGHSSPLAPWHITSTNSNSLLPVWEALYSPLCDIGLSGTSVPTAVRPIGLGSKKGNIPSAASSLLACSW